MNLKSKKTWLSRITLSLLIVLGSGCSQELGDVPLHGADYSAARLTPTVQLRDTQGTPTALKSFNGKVLVLFFGYTHCPEICPTALTRAVQIRQRLGKDAANVQFAFATLDPERDSPSILQTYVRSFNPEFIGLTGSEEEIKAAAKELSVVYAKVPSGDTYAIDHSTRSYVFDRQGRLRVGLAHAQSVEDCVEDIRHVLALSKS